MARPFALRLNEDLLAPGGHLLFPADGVNRIVYVVHGAIEIARKGFSDDESWHGRGAAKVEATSIGPQSGDGSLRLLNPGLRCSSSQTVRRSRNSPAWSCFPQAT